MRVWIGVLILCATAPAAAQRVTDAASSTAIQAASSREDAARILVESPALSNRTHPPQAVTESKPVMGVSSSPTTGPFGEFIKPAVRRSDPTVVSRKRVQRSNSRRRVSQPGDRDGKTGVTTTPTEAPKAKRRASSTGTGASQPEAAHGKHRELGP